MVQIAASKWLIGSSMICESDLPGPPEDVKTSWKGDDGKTFYLRTAPASLVAAPAVEHTSESFEVNRIHKAGTSAAVWAFGGVHIKVKSWVPELESEQVTIEHVRRANIPVPEVISSWVDHAWNRSFLILKSIPGRTLDQAWPDLSFSERRKIADEIASFCTTLAMSCHKRMETLSGKGIREDFLTRKLSPDVPSWMPNVAGPFTVEQLESYLRNPSIATGPDFYFYHADLGPTNIILDDDNNVAAVIDWESAAFYPRFWIATKPLVSAGFYLSCGDRGDRHEWAELLSRALEAKGFEADMEMYQRWRATLDA